MEQRGEIKTSWGREDSSERTGRTPKPGFTAAVVPMVQHWRRTQEDQEWTHILGYTGKPMPALVHESLAQPFVPKQCFSILS